ncbi:hypothetical protein ACSVDA_06525 [Cytobacillus sp. Hm23]
MSYGNHQRGGDINIACGESMTILAGNFRGLLTGNIVVLDSSECGLRATITTNGTDFVFDVPPRNDPGQNDNVFTFSYTNVTRITVMCLSDGGDNCIGSYFFKFFDRCISTSLPNQ